MVKTSPFKAGGEGLIPGQGVKGLPWWLSDKESACNAGDTYSVPGSGKSIEVGSGNPLQYSCLGNSMIRGAWRATVYGVAKESDMTQ